MNKYDKFALRAESYDETVYRQRYVEEMAQTLLSRIPFRTDMTIMDFGAGTGLLSERIAPYVGRIVAVDISDSMLEQFEKKARTFPCETVVKKVNLLAEEWEDRFDAIISSMTLHHIDPIPLLLRRMYAMLQPGGHLGLCDIDPEDGSFHTVDTGVVHHGIDRELLKEWVESAGFDSVEVSDCCIIRKPHGEYPAFALTARKA